MSILISGMEMPTSCASCDIACRHYLDFGVDGLLSKICRTESRRPDCPLVPVPSHGRLIDADALMVNAQYKGKYDILTAYDVVSAPTIIPAEEGET